MLDSKICHFWFTLVCNHPTMQDCFFFLSFLHVCFPCVLRMATLHIYTLLPRTLLASCLFHCMLGNMLPPSLLASTCFHHHYLLPPLLLTSAIAIVACFHFLVPFCFCHHCLLPHASAITASSSTSLAFACFTTCLLALLFACLTFELAPVA
jgi:hypothetical protein